jgi:glycerol kinase
LSRLIVALDQGSSSTRALALTEQGKVVGRAQIKVETKRPRAGWFEHDAAALAAGAERALASVVSNAKKVEIAGIGIAAQRSTVVFWDAKTGKPLCLAPSWQDGRAAEIVAPLQGRQQEAHSVTGLYLTPYYSAPTIRWTHDKVPAVQRILGAE